MVGPSSTLSASRSVPTFGFSRAQRLLTPDQFKAVFDQPDWRVSDRHFLILARRNGNDLARLGLVIGRRRARRAVDRAAIKRRGREQFRLRQQALAGLDVIILLRGNYSGKRPAGDLPKATSCECLLTPQLSRLLDKLLAKCRQD